MLSGRCCVTEPHSRAALRLDIFIEILTGHFGEQGQEKGPRMLRPDPVWP
jgi:hypothetical protein